MNPFKKLRLYCLFASLLILQISIGQTLDTIQLINRQSILNDRAWFTFPQYAQNIKRGVDIMAADPNSNEETRIVLDIGSMRLVFFARELFTLANQNFVQTISNQNQKAGFNVKPLTDKDGFQSILSSPLEFDSTKDAILVNDLLVKTPDGSVFRISAFINPAAMPLKNQFQSLTEKVFQSLEKGSRIINRSAKQQKIKIEGTNKSFTFNLPPNYFINVDRQYDFQVFKIHKYESLNDTTWQQLIIYSGNHPSPVYYDYGLTEKDAKRIKGKFLNKSVDWLNFFVAAENFIDKEQLIPSDNIGKGFIIHIAMMSNQQKRIDELTKIVETIQLTN